MGYFIYELACCTVGCGTASGGLPWNFQSTEYTGKLSSNQRLVACDSTFNLSTPPCLWIRIAFMGAPSLYRLRSYGALCAPLIANLFTPRTPFSASQRVSSSDDQASWANTTLIAASLFGQSVSGRTCSSPKSRIFLFRRDAESITARLASRAPKNHPQYELFRSSFTASPGLGIRCNKEEFAIWKPRPSRFAVVRGSRRAHCRNDDVRLCETKDHDALPAGTYFFVL